MSDKGILILCYHKIEDTEDILNMSTSTKTFEKQLVTLKKFYKIISLSDAIDLLNSNVPVPYNAIVITFDDGYRCLYTNAYPIIKKHGIPITIFLTANAIDDNIIIWHDEICLAIDETNKEKVLFDNKEFHIGNQYAKNNFKKYIVEVLKKMKEDKKNELIREFMSQLNNKEKNGTSNLYLKKEEIIEMGKNGVQFGSHSLNHTILTQMPLESVRKEIIYSKAKLEEELKMRIDYFAYPNGNYNNELKNIVKEAGYSCALTLDYGDNKKNTDMFSLKRMNITESNCINNFGRFSKALFLCEVTGINKILVSPFNFLNSLRRIFS